MQSRWETHLRCHYLVVIHPAAASKRCFSRSNCVPDAKTRVVSQEPETGSRKEIDTFSITAVYKSFPFLFTELMENHLLEESLYRPLAAESPTACDPAMPPLSAPLSFLRYTSRRWKKLEAWRTALRFRESLPNGSDHAHAPCLAHVLLAWPGVVLPWWSIHAGTWWRLPQRLSLLGTQVSITRKTGCQQDGCMQVSLRGGDRFGQGKRETWELGSDPGLDTNPGITSDFFFYCVCCGRSSPTRNRWKQRKGTMKSAEAARSLQAFSIFTLGVRALRTGREGQRKVSADTTHKGAVEPQARFRSHPVLVNAATKKSMLRGWMLVPFCTHRNNSLSPCLRCPVHKYKRVSLQPGFVNISKALKSLDGSVFSINIGQ